VWHKVIVENASKYPKEDVYDALLKAFPQDNHRLKFTPLCFSKQGMNYVFFVELEGVADALSKMSRNVYMYGTDSGQTLSIRVDRSPPPKMNVNDEMWEKAKLVMSSRCVRWPITKLTTEKRSKQSSVAELLSTGDIF